MGIILNRNLWGMLVIAAAAFGLYWYINSLRIEIKDLQVEVAEMKSKYDSKSFEVERLEAVIETQNKAINELKVSEEKHLAELEEWKNKPAEVKYKYIKDIIYKDKEVKSNDCEDIKAVIDNVRKLDFSRM